MNYLELLETELRLFDLQIPFAQRILLGRYCDELERWSRRINLTSLSGSDLVRRLIVEPVWIAEQIKLSGILVDVGSGNGSPALPIHITRGLDRVHLVEARAKRAAFLRHMSSKLKLEGVIVHRARFQDSIQEFAGADWVTLQGVALTSSLIKAFRSISSDTLTIMWITASAEPPVRPLFSLRVPRTDTQAFLFRLDQF